MGDGADPNWRPNECAQTNTCVAAFYGLLSGVRYLVGHGGDVNIRDEEGRTVGHVGRAVIIDILVGRSSAA